MRLSRFVARLFVISFVANYIWESLHVRLYTGYAGLSGPLPLALWATIGDVLYVFLCVALLSLARRGWRWALEPSAADYISLAGIGFAIALFVEYKAMYFHSWSYLSAMPIIPILGVGLTPTVQMTILVPLSVGVAAFLAKR